MTPPSGTRALLEVRDLKKYFPVRQGFFGRRMKAVHAVDGVSFDIAPGEVLGLVGESGCGKSTTGRLILRLIEATAGRILFNGEDLLAADRKRLRKLRRQIQIVFQDPYASLNPRMRIGAIIEEPLIIHKIGDRETRRRKVEQLIERVGLGPDVLLRYPHEFSGGQRQRIGIARALALEPRLIVADEPVSSLDVSIQAQVINLLEDLQEEYRLSLLFIAHDLNMVRHISDRVAVMYLGQIVELASAETLYLRPKHPYTEALLQSIPVPDPTVRPRKPPLEGDLPSPIDLPPGCRFYSRCPKRIDRCVMEEPRIRELEPLHFVSCHVAS